MKEIDLGKDYRVTFNVSKRPSVSFASLGLSQFIVPAVCVVMLSINLSPFWAFFLAASASLSTLFPTWSDRRTPVLLDIALVLLYASSCISTFFAYDTFTALPQFGLRTIFILLYLACRYFDAEIVTLVSAAGIGSIVYCLHALVLFFKSYRLWDKLNFTSLVDFRSIVTLTAPGIRPGNHNATYLIALSIGMYGLRKPASHFRLEGWISLVVVFLAMVCALLSFSRALYLSAFICLSVGAWGGLRKSSAGRKLLAAALGLVILAILSFKLFGAHFILEGMRDTILFGTRLSQERSTSGRLTIYRTALRLIGSNAWFGSGISNYALALRRQGLTTPSVLTAHPFNVLLEVTIEQGIVGATALILALAGSLKLVWQRIQTGEAKALIGGIMGLLLFSLSQTYFIADQATAVLLAVFCAILANGGNCYA